MRVDRAHEDDLPQVRREDAKHKKQICISGIRRDPEACRQRPCDFRCSIQGLRQERHPVAKRIVGDSTGGGRPLAPQAVLRAVEIEARPLRARNRPRILVALDEALERLAAMDERRGRVVELRFFGGLSVEETAAVLQVSRHTVMRDWALARTWLFNELRRGGEPPV